MIIVKDLHKTFENNRVLRGVNYHVHQGEKIVVIGPSGSGKSTFLRCLNLLEVPTSGEIWFDIVIPVSASPFITSSTSPTISGSNAEVGSSKSITRGFMASDRTIATRCFCPPDN